MDNIFLSLYKWGKPRAKSEDEDYFSKSLALILERLLKGNKRLGVQAINSFVSQPLGLSLDVTAGIKIKPQQTISETYKKRPDITVSTGNTLIYVEVKVDSPVDREARKRLKKYFIQLERKKARGKIKSTGILLLTRSGHERTDSIPLKQISWFDVTESLKSILEQVKCSTLSESAMSSLLEEFIDFLKENNMGICKVKDELDAEAIHNSINLLGVIRHACEDADLELSYHAMAEIATHDKSKESWIGYWCNKGDCGIGIYPGELPKIYFEIHDSDSIERIFKQDNKRVRTMLHPQASLWEDNTIVGVSLNLAKEGFFKDGITERQQVEIIKEFIEQILGKWRSLKKDKRFSRKARS